MAHHQLIVPIPSNWYEVPNDRHAYRRRQPERSGWLRVGVYPPTDDAITDEASAIRALENALAATGINPGERVAEACDEGGLGLIATPVHKHPRFGLVQHWFARPEVRPGLSVSVLATYEMGDLRAATTEMREAHQTILDMHFVEDPGLPGAGG